MHDAFEVSDVTGQKVLAVSSVPSGTTVADLVRGLITRMRLPASDTSGRPLTYHARSDREGRHLLSGEQVAHAIHPGDRIVLQPNVDAGGSLPCGRTIGS
jgi:hypothetical protein